MKNGIWIALLAGLAWGRAEGGWIVQAYYQDHVLQTPRLRIPVLLERRTAKLDISSLTGDQSAILYDFDRGKVWHIRHADKTYAEYDAAKLEAMQNGLSGAVEWLGQLTGKSTETPAGGQRKTPVVRETGEQLVLSGLACRKMEVIEGGQAIQEIWYASWADSGMRKSDLFALIKLGEFYERLWTTPGMSSLSSMLIRVPLENVLKLDAYPVLIRFFKARKPHLSIELSEPTRMDMPASVFTIPAGYKKTWF